VVAAKVEVEGARASAQLMVRGYKGSTLGGLLPAWQSFGVDSYGQHMTAITGLQKAIMQDAGNIQPELLATTVLSPEVRAPGEAVGTVYALHAVAEDATLAHALDRLGTDDSSVVEAVKALYRSVVGEDDRAVPGQQQRQDAQDQLHGLPHQPELVPGLRYPVGRPRALVVTAVRDRSAAATPVSYCGPAPAPGPATIACPGDGMESSSRPWWRGWPRWHRT
jgi:hypothetical protein